MNHSAKITSKGQITLPADIRKELGLAAGDKVDFVKNASGKFELKPRTGRFADLIGILKLDRPVSDKEINDWVKEARGEMAMRSIDDWD
jgi:antitoxin PrlF